MADFFNCIIDGNNAIELRLRSNGINAFQYSFTNCLIKFRDNNGQFASDPLYDFENSSLYEEIIQNEDANFLNVNENDFRISNPSAVDGLGNIETATRIPFDILGTDRISSPSLGAYQILQ